MFPRPRKITRLLVLTSVIVVIFTTFVYLFGNSDPTNLNSTHFVQGKMGVLARSMVYSHQYSSIWGNTERTNPKQPGSKGTSLEEEDEASAEIFKYLVQSKVGNSAFLKDSTRDANDDDVRNNNENSFEYQLTSPQSKSLVNPHDFKYIHNPHKLCSRKSLTFLVYIHSSPANRKKRQAIRHTWGNLRLLSLFNTTLVFILGATPDNLVQKLVDMESNVYGDIVQEDFVDSYRNLTYKGMTALKWVSRYCNRVAFVLKTDDDILLDVVSVIDHLVNQVIPHHGANKLVLCNLWTRMKAMRNPRSKWYLSKEEFPVDLFPPYCSGSFYLLSTDLISDMYRTALNSPFFWVDDYFITGVLVNSLSVKHVPYNQAYLLNYNVVEEKLKNDKKEYTVLHIKKLDLFLKMWPFLTKRHKGMKQFLASRFHPYSRQIFNHSNSEGGGGGPSSVNKRRNESTSLSTLKESGVTERGLTGNMSMRQ